MQWLKDATKRLPPPLFRRVFYAWHAATVRRTAESVRRAYGIALLKELELNRHSDTVFVLGSGSSINAISPERWQTIAGHDSIGFNLWPIHPFVPTFYFIECATRARSAEFFQDYNQVASRRAADYASVPKVVTELESAAGGEEFAGRHQWRSTLYTVPTIPVPARNEEEFAAGLRDLRQRGLFQPATRVRRLFKQANSLSMLLSLAVVLGYRNIVLCGIDLRDGLYFYQDETLYPDTADWQFAPKSRPHLTNTPKAWRITTEVIVRQFKQVVLDPAGIRLYVENRVSALWPGVDEAPASMWEGVPACRR